MDSATAIVNALTRAGTRMDPRQIAEAIWLTSILPPAAPEPAPAGQDPAVSDLSTNEPTSGTVAEERSTPRSPSSETRMTGFSEEWPDDEASSLGAAGTVRMRRATMRRQAWHPDANAVGRSLRPLRRSRITGPDDFDLDRTIELMESTGGAVFRPVLAPGRRPWFDSAVLITDTAPSAPLWTEASGRIVQTLRNSRAFRDVRHLRVTLPEEGPTQLKLPPALSAIPDERKLVIVLSDFSADRWYGAQTWRWIVDLAQRSPLLLLTPLSSRLWSRTGLCAPAARVIPVVQGATSRLLSDAAGTATAVPVATLTARSLARWASSLMGRSGMPLDVLQIRPTDFDSRDIDEPPRPTDSERLENFLTTASPTAHRLAVMISPWPHVSLELLSLLRSELVPEAEPGDVAELVLGGLFDITATKNGSLVLSFREEPRRVLEAEITRTEIWDVYEVIDRLVSSETRPGGGSLLLPDTRETEAGPRDETGFVPALIHLADVLGIEPRQAWTNAQVRVGGGSPGEYLSGTRRPLSAAEFRSIVLAQALKRMNETGGPIATTPLGGQGVLVSFLDHDGSVRVTVRNPDSDGPGLTAHLPHEMLRRLADRDDGLWALDLLCLALAGEHLAGIDRALASGVRRIGNALADRSSFLPPLDVLRLSRERDIENRLLRRHGSVAIIGPSGSGKTFQARYWQNRCFLYDPMPAGMIVLDLIDPYDGPASIIEALLLQPSRSWYLLVVENIHANPECARNVFELVDRLRSAGGVAISVLATSRADVAGVVPDGFLIEHTRPAALFDRRLRDLDLSPAQRQRIEVLCGNGQDLVLLGHVLYYLDEHGGRLPTDEQFVDYIGGVLGLDRLVSRDLREAVYHFACLGMYEIDIPASYAETMFREAIVALRDVGLIERADTSYRVWSVSVGAAIAKYALRNWAGDPEWPMPQPAELAAEILATAGDEQIKAMLSRVRSGADRASSRVASAWAQRGEISRRLARYVAQDPEWEQDATSAAYAAIAMAHLGMADHWLTCAEFVREAWDYGDGFELPSRRSAEPTRESEDFRTLREVLRMEDSLSNAPERVRNSADELELDVMHRIWMTAMLLSMEAIAPPEHQDDRRRHALTSALVWEIEADGLYYLELIPWLSARVLSSLCDAGAGQGTAADLAAQGLALSIGRPVGTGSWGSVEVSAMCIVALAKHDEWGSRELLLNAYTGLDAQVRLYSEHTGLSETDKALVMEAFLLSPDPVLKEKAYGYLDDLLAWLREGRNWQADVVVRDSPIADAGDAVSARLAFVLCKVTSCIWLMAKDALLPIFEDVAAEFGIPRASAPATLASPPRPQVSADPDPFDVGVEPDLVACALDSLDRVERELVENITARETALRAVRNQRSRTVIQSVLADFLEQKRTCASLRRRLSIEPVKLTTIQDIEGLSLEVLGDRAPRLID